MKPENDSQHSMRVARMEAFLAAYAVHGNVTAAADAVQINRGAHYAWLTEDDAYAERFQQAKREFADLLVERARQKALEGVRRYVISAGKLVIGLDGQPLVETEFSDTLHLALLKAKLPDEFRDRATLEHGGLGGGPIRQEVKADVSPEFVAAVLGHLRDAGHADPAGDPGQPLDTGGSQEAEP